MEIGEEIAPAMDEPADEDADVEMSTGDGPTPPGRGCAVSTEEKREEYNKGACTGSSALGAARASRKKADIPLVLKDFINAARRGFACRRTVIAIYYSNDKRGTR